MREAIAGRFVCAPCDPLAVLADDPAGGDDVENGDPVAWEPFDVEGDAPAVVKLPTEANPWRVLSDRSVTVRSPRVCGRCRGQIEAGDLARSVATAVRGEGIRRDYYHFQECSGGGNDLEWRDALAGDRVGSTFG